MTVIDGNATDRLFHILTGASASISVVTIQNGVENDGGGIFIGNTGTVRVTNSTVNGNTANEGSGGGIYNLGTLTLTNSTVSGNTAADGGGIATVGSSVELTNTIVANSLPGEDCFGSVTSGGHNLDDDGTCGLMEGGDLSNVDAHLAPLGDYGGPTDTQALCTGEGIPDASCVAASPAIDAGDNASCLDTDQRGVERPQPPGGACDIGAYEAE